MLELPQFGAAGSCFRLRFGSQKKIMSHIQRAGIWKIDRILLQTTGSFLRRLRQRLLVIILIAVVPILAFILYQGKLARDLQLAEAHEAAWKIVENVAV